MVEDTSCGKLYLEVVVVNFMEIGERIRCQMHSENSLYDLASCYISLHVCLVSM